MTDSLRTRIAAAIRAVDDMRVCKLSDADIKFIVDAVVRELGLRQESTDRVIYPDLPAEIINGKKYTRYVTDWKADDE